MSEIFISNSDKCINSQQASHSRCPSKYHLSVYVVWFFLRSNGKNTLFDNFSDSCVHFNRRVNKQNRPQKKILFDLSSNTSDTVYQETGSSGWPWPSKFRHFFYAHLLRFGCLFQVLNAHPCPLLFNVMLFYYMNKNCTRDVLRSAHDEQ